MLPMALKGGDQASRRLGLLQLPTPPVSHNPWTSRDRCGDWGGCMGVVLDFEGAWCSNLSAPATDLSLCRGCMVHFGGPTRLETA